MKIKVIIEHNENDIPSSIEDLKLLMSNYEIITSFNVEDIIKSHILDNDIFYVYYRNPYIRYPELNKFIELILVQNDYPCVYSDKELIGISKKYLNSPHVKLDNFPVTYAKPLYDPISILLYTHKRADYLKLSLNALLYSLEDDITNITIAMSEPSPEVEAIVQGISEKYPSINILKSKENIACAIINAYLQIQRPQKFIIFEEDFILPQYTKFILPYWRRQFNYLLEKYDIVNFQTSIENQNFNFFTGLYKSKRNTSFSFQHSWITDKNNDIHITGNGFASNTKFYASLGNNPPFYISGDGAIYNKAKNICVSSIHGYHIGWNQEMDGYMKIESINRFPNPDSIQKITDIKTNEVYTIDLRKITEL